MGRWAYPVGACFVLLGVAPLFAQLPGLLSDSSALARGQAMIDDDHLDEASAELAGLSERYPDSFRVYAALACLGAKRDDDEAWAQNVQLALIAGMPYTLVRQCRALDELGQFRLVRTGGLVVLRARVDEPTDRITVSSAPTASAEDTVAELAAASCDNGLVGYDVLAGVQAFTALQMSVSLGTLEATKATVAACLDSWPDARPREVLEELIEP